MLSIETSRALVEVLAIIRPNAVTKTVRALERIKQLAFTRWRALGRGRQGGIRVDSDQADAPSIEWLSKVVLTVVVPADRAKATVDAIVSANQSGRVGDGRIFVCPLDEEVSVRTGGRCAIPTEA